MSPNDGRRKADVGAASMTGLHGSQKRRRTCLSAGRFDLRRPSLAGLVVIAGSLNPIPSRTRPLNSLAPMVLSLKAWKSRSLPGLPRTSILLITIDANERPSRTAAAQVTLHRCARTPRPAKPRRRASGDGGPVRATRRRDQNLRAVGLGRAAPGMDFAWIGPSLRGAPRGRRSHPAPAKSTGIARISP